LDQSSLNIAQQQFFDFGACPHQFNQCISFYLQRSARNLNDAPVRGDTHSKDQRNADEVLGSDGLDFNWKAISGPGGQGGCAVFEEVGIL